MIALRKVDPETADLLSQIAYAAKASWGYPAAWMEAWSAVFAFSPEYFETHESWTVVVDERPVAFCTLLVQEGIAWLENLWVLPEYMGRGVGKRLFLFAVDVARQRGFKRLRLESDPYAEGFYAKLGMFKIGERRADMDGQPRSLPLMELTL
jgi:GNAT superfamily N-acetyltransferase